MTGADVGLATGGIPEGWPGLVTGPDVAGTTGAEVPGGLVGPVAGAAPGFDEGAANAGGGVPARTGAPLAGEVLLDVFGFVAGAALRAGGVGVGGSGGATSLGGAAWAGCAGRCCAGWSGTVGRSWAGIGVG